MAYPTFGVAVPVITRAIPTTSNLDSGITDPMPTLPETYSVPLTSNVCTGTAIPIPTFPADVSTYSWLVLTAKSPVVVNAILRPLPAAGVTVKAPDDVKLLPDKFSVPAIVFVPALFAFNVPVNIVLPVTFSVDPSVTAPVAFNVPVTSNIYCGIDVPIPKRPVASSQKNFALFCAKALPGPTNTTDPCVNPLGAMLPWIFVA